MAISVILSLLILSSALFPSGARAGWGTPGHADLPTSAAHDLSSVRKAVAVEPVAAGTAAGAPPSVNGVATVPVGSRPDWATYDSRNGFVYVSNEGSVNVSVISGTSIVGTVNVGPRRGIQRTTAGTATSMSRTPAPGT